MSCSSGSRKCSHPTGSFQCAIIHPNTHRPLLRYPGARLRSRHRAQLTVPVESIPDLLLQVQLRPASALTISMYAAYLSCKPSSYQSILNHLNAMRLFHLFSGVTCDALASFDVTLTKRGLKRLMGSAPKQKYPITIPILRDIRGALDLSRPSHAAIWCLFLVAFFSFLRR